MAKIKDHSLYLVITEKYGNGRGALEIAAAAIAGDVDIVQMREKDRSRSELVSLGGKLSKLCIDAGVLFIVNDDPEIAKETGADGVHLGQDDIKSFSIEDARRIMGKDKIIGVSAHSIDIVKRSDTQDVDYIAFGPVFPTEIKNGCTGTQYIKEALAATSKPLFFIGGIDICNVDGLLSMGAKNIAVIRAISNAENITEKTKAFKSAIVRMKGK